MLLAATFSAKRCACTKGHVSFRMSHVGSVSSKVGCICMSAFLRTAIYDHVWTACWKVGGGLFCGAASNNKRVRKTCCEQAQTLQRHKPLEKSTEDRHNNTTLSSGCREFISGYGIVRNFGWVSWPSSQDWIDPRALDTTNLA